MYVSYNSTKDMYALVKAQRDGLDVKSVAAIFDLLMLPQPRRFEYRSTSDFGFLVFLNDQACTVRITSNLRCPPLDHPRILKPLYRFDLGRHRLDINPGIKLGNATLPVKWVAAILENDKIDFWDQDPRNCGAIPKECTNSLFDYTVVCDEGACRADSELAPGMRTLFNRLVTVANDNALTRQDRAYGALRRAFQEAIGTRSEAKMRAAWALCSEKKKIGHLRADWINPPEAHPHNSRDYAENYAGRLAHLRP